MGKIELVYIFILVTNALRVRIISVADLKYPRGQ